jgi:glycine cleavage system H protein
MNIPKELKYVKSHEWVRLEDDLAVVGITDFAQSQMGDLTFVELPSVGDQFDAEDEVAVVESVKAASDIYMPIDGEIVEINEVLADSPEVINNDPYGDGWMFKIKPSDVSQVEALLTFEQYEEQIPSDG